MAQEKFLTDKQKRVLNFINERKTPVSVDKVALQFGVTRTTARNYIRFLIIHGFVDPVNILDSKTGRMVIAARRKI